MNSNAKPVGILGQYDSPGELLQAAEKFRDAGYKKFDCHSPFPIHGMDQAMGLKRSILGWIVGIAAITGAIAGLVMQWWTSAVEYPLVIAGKELFSYQAFIPVTFGVAVLFSAFTALFSMLALNGLPRLHHPVFYSDNFGKFSDDCYFLSLEASDKKYDETSAREILESTGAKNIELLVEND